MTRRPVTVFDANTIKCKVFPITLEGAARTWYNTMKNGSIHSFRQLTDNFSKHFINNRRSQVRIDHLQRVYQRSGETLEDFAKRFHKEAVRGVQADPEQVSKALIDGLDNRDLFYLLNKDSPWKFTALLAELDKHIKAEAAMAVRERLKKRLGSLPDRREKNEERSSDRNTTTDPTRRNKKDGLKTG